MKITTNQFSILRTLWESRKWMTNREIVRETDLNITSLWQATQSLTDLGLVIKMRLSLRGEPVRYKITREGRKVFRVLKELNENVLQNR